MSCNFFFKNKGPFSIKKILAISGSKNFSELDITDSIIDELNKKLPSIKLN